LVSATFRAGCAKTTTPQKESRRRIDRKPDMVVIL
jgi:hypothetical protein